MTSENLIVLLDKGLCTYYVINFDVRVMVKVRVKVRVQKCLGFDP